MAKTRNKLQGFTLIEVLVVIALIAVLATIVIIAINPQQTFQDARNAQRNAHVNAILNAVTQFTSRQNQTIGDLGVVRACDDVAGPTAIGTTTGGAAGAFIDLDGTTSTDQLTETFLVSIPLDPSNGTAADTGYTICTTPGGRVRIDAPGAEGTTISVER